MNIAGKRNRKRPTGGGGTTHTKGRTKADQRAAQSGQQEAAEGPTQETHRQLLLATSVSKG